MEYDNTFNLILSNMYIKEKELSFSGWNTNKQDVISISGLTMFFKIIQFFNHKTINKFK